MIIATNGANLRPNLTLIGSSTFVEKYSNRILLLQKTQTILN